MPQEYHDEGSCIERKEQPVSHFDDLGIKGVPNIRDKAAAVIRMINEKEHGCLQLINQLLSIAGLAVSISGRILERHIRECLKEEGYPRNEDERDKETERARRYRKRLYKKWKLKGYARKKLEETEYNLY